MDDHGVVLGIEDHHFDVPAGTVGADDEDPVAQVDHPAPLPDGMEDVLVGNAMLPGAFGELHNDRVPCRGSGDKISCRVDRPVNPVAGEVRPAAAIRVPTGRVLEISPIGNANRNVVGNAGADAPRVRLQVAPVRQCPQDDTNVERVAAIVAGEIDGAVRLGARPVRRGRRRAFPSVDQWLAQVDKGRLTEEFHVFLLRCGEVG